MGWDLQAALVPLEIKAWTAQLAQQVGPALQSSRETNSRLLANVCSVMA